MATSGSTRTTLISPFQYFADPTRARPIFNGFIFIGRVDGDPTNTADQIPVQVICECGGSPVNVTQPIRTGPGGLPIYNGSPAQIVVCRSNYSITLQDNNRVQVYHSPNVQSGVVNQPITHTTLAAAMADDNSNRQVIRLLERGGAEFRRAANQAEYDRFPSTYRLSDSADILWVIKRGVSVKVSNSGTSYNAQSIMDADIVASIYGMGVLCDVDVDCGTVEAIVRNLTGFDSTGLITGQAPDIPVLTVLGNHSRLSSATYNIRSVKRSDDSETVPAIRMAGFKGALVNVGETDVFQMFAQTTTHPNYVNVDSCAYNQINILHCCAFRILGVQDDVIAWCNENTISLNRVTGSNANSGIFIEGPFGHSHNEFQRLTLEGTKTINITRGNNNRLLGMRFERDGSNPLDICTINMGDTTFSNHVQCTWAPAPGFINAPTGFETNQVVVTDTGSGNSIVHVQEEDSIDLRIVSLGKSVTLSGTDSAYSNTNIKGVANIKQGINGLFTIRQQFRPIYLDISNNYSVSRGDFITVSSDMNLFRYSVYCFDESASLIIQEPVGALVGFGLIWSSTQKAFVSSSNASFARAVINNTSIVKRVAVAVIPGNATSGSTFRYMYLSLRRSKKAIRGPRDNEVNYLTNLQRSNTVYFSNANDISYSNIRSGTSLYNITNDSVINKYAEIIGGSDSTSVPDKVKF